MRGVAKTANMRLANVQYYFPTKKDLINALIEHVITSYNERYESLDLDEMSNPKSAFEKLIDMNLSDAFNQKTRHFFIQFWPLLSEADNYSGEFLANLYNHQIATFRAYILKLCPEISPNESLIRAKAIVSLIDGSMVVRLNSDEEIAHQPNIQNIMKSYILTLAMSQSDSTM
ncbi:MAG: hypothetical protein COA68_16955 [Oceanobacter sp.]|nr:MAG: hypothetical protein COA68_16955 [Oceanobacter sp.]